ncbi:hypothetical protein KL930_000801 [Ogataea haglerorum]|uniref:DNA primase n=1 Tax=Ogataea haglerorum TaxID=1937702 RepID=A0ABQ7RNR5_9ASCO|nr:uncharacterized protein KL911_003484 [Ogataea haglerorum]KAG7700114.1 hypothetical protein KL915_000803 [Ogataea haglerorum]KAG7712356.1 hypothetical protein KL950_000227 [Ogataea haglerorum]KAG7742920.1 hypothetical protein KL923_000535 [Ogataea haglerorum]KAG7752753.1 hypothetical protein KL911_003484 [Ogataea haglerorum]KAG7769252.1 hypothetical protein KL946_000535 [Ogataea haglerorum]
MPILENSSSPPASSPLPSSQVNVDASPLGDEVSLKNYKPSSADMAYYYEHFLPFKSIYLWLNHSQAPQSDFTMREFAFEYKSGAYQRYNSFHSATEFKQSVVKAQPTRFEVGAVYPVEPRMRKSVSKALMKPVAKEVVLDIDLTDYDDVRTCCSGTDICPKCWRFITLAVKIVHRALQEDFGFEHLIWVFSGRRGVHCWVSDYRARILDESRRRAIVEYLDVLSVKSKKTLNLKKPYHPHVERAGSGADSAGLQAVERADQTLEGSARPDERGEVARRGRVLPAAQGAVVRLTGLEKGDDFRHDVSAAGRRGVAADEPPAEVAILRPSRHGERVCAVRPVREGFRPVCRHAEPGRAGGQRHDRVAEDGAAPQRGAVQQVCEPSGKRGGAAQAGPGGGKGRSGVLKTKKYLSLCPAVKKNNLTLAVFLQTAGDSSRLGI